MRINIVFGATQDWFQYTCISALSILNVAAKEEKYHFYILSDGFSKLDKKKFYKLTNIADCEFHFITLDNAYFDGAIHDWLGVSSSYRLRIPSFIQESKVLYLDSDIIAIKNISELYNTDISNYYLAAVEDKQSIYRNSIINLEKEHTYVNGGVQLINVNKFRELNLEKKIFEVLRKNNYTDQDVINDVCRGHILYLPLKYNINTQLYLVRKKEAAEALKDPVLVHFGSKPWLCSAMPYGEKYTELCSQFENIKEL